MLAPRAWHPDLAKPAALKLEASYAFVALISMVVPWDADSCLTAVIKYCSGCAGLQQQPAGAAGAAAA